MLETSSRQRTAVEQGPITPRSRAGGESRNSPLPRGHPRELQVTTRELPSLDDATRERLREDRDHQCYMYRDIIEEGILRRVFATPQAEVTAYLLLELCGWLHIMRFSLELQLPESQLVYCTRISESRH
jgi:hypothetical protein